MMGATLGLAQASSMIALGPLDEGDKRGEGYGHHLIKSQKCTVD